MSKSSMSANPEAAARSIAGSASRTESEAELAKRWRISSVAPSEQAWASCCEMAGIFLTQEVGDILGGKRGHC